MRVIARLSCFCLTVLALTCIFLSLPHQFLSSEPEPRAIESESPQLSKAPEPQTATDETPSVPSLPAKVDFNFHIKPILSDRCFACHGPDKAQVAGGLQLNDPELAFRNLAEEGEPNRYALMPGAPEQSEVVKRITSDNPDMRMPPTASNRKPLSRYEQQLIRQWITDGAEYKQHWAFIPPVKTPLPHVVRKDWARNVIDVFILTQLEARGMTPSPEADRETLIRRLYFDLTGLPPSPEEIDAFIEDSDAGAYERLVDRLLASPHYGERLALEWLDVARYADTHAIHVDMARTSWPWRDWVIKAFNGNKPYDRFVVEQLAGDLLPAATLDQKIATSFNRHHGISDEGGAIDEELRAEYAADRVGTVGTAFMGLTLNCARCHDHKYDPISMDDYYSMMSFFNSVDEEKGQEVQDEHTAYAYRPYVEIWEPNERREFDRNAELLKEIESKSDWTDSFANDYNDWSDKALAWLDLLAEGESPATEGEARTKVWDITIANKQDIFERIRDPNVSQAFSSELTLPAHGEPVNLFRIEVPELHPLNDLHMAYAFVPALLRSLTIETPGQIKKVDEKETTEWSAKAIAWSWAPTWGSPSNNGPEQVLDGDPNTFWEVTPTDRPYTLFLLLDEPIEATDQPSKVRITLTFMKGGTHFPQQAKVFATTCVGGLETIQRLAPYSPLALIPAANLSDWQKRSLVLDRLQSQGKVAKDIHAIWCRAQDRQFALQKNVLRCMVMKEMAEPRPTYVLKRGQYDQPDPNRPRGRAIPTVFGTLPEDSPANRLGLARWLTAPDNPLLSRVTVNRYWQMLFGTGLVRTTEDFGAQGEVPSHPALLDYLAVDLQESGWNLKLLLRMMVISATYRQQANRRPEYQNIDPENRFLSHYPRRRLQAEMIRDNALAAAGLLVRTVGGPSVRPYQPPGLWRERAMRKENSTGTFVQDSGSNLYRRSMYTFWKQAAPPPQMATFDAPSREVCVVRRSRTNTPLQALILQNDETYLEIARVLAERVMLEIPGAWLTTLEQRLERSFRLLTGRHPDPPDIEILKALTQRNLETFSVQNTPENQARMLLQYGEAAAEDRLPKNELAALAFTVSAIINLDETITQD